MKNLTTVAEYWKNGSGFSHSETLAVEEVPDDFRLEDIEKLGLDYFGIDEEDSDTDVEITVVLEGAGKLTYWASDQEAEDHFDSLRTN